MTTVTVKCIDGDSQVITGKVKFKQKAGVAVLGGAAVLQKVLTLPLDEDGEGSIDLVAGAYEVTLPGNNVVDIAVPDDDGTYPLTALIDGEAPVIESPALIATAKFRMNTETGWPEMNLDGQWYALQPVLVGDAVMPVFDQTPTES